MNKTQTPRKMPQTKNVDASTESVLCRACNGITHRKWQIRNECTQGRSHQETKPTHHSNVVVGSPELDSNAHPAHSFTTLSRQDLVFKTVPWEDRRYSLVPRSLATLPSDWSLFAQKLPTAARQVNPSHLATKESGAVEPGKSCEAFDAFYQSDHASCRHRLCEDQNSSFDAQPRLCVVSFCGTWPVEHAGCPQSFPASQFSKPHAATLEILTGFHDFSHDVTTTSGQQTTALPSTSSITRNYS